MLLPEWKFNNTKNVVPSLALSTDPSQLQDVWKSDIIWTNLRQMVIRSL